MTLSLAVVLRTFANPVTGLYVSGGPILAGGPRGFLSEANLNRILLGLRKGIQVFSRVVLFTPLEFGFGSSFITRTMRLILLPSSRRLPGCLGL